MMTGKRLFGTDGIRGVAGEFPLDPRTAFAFGSALGAYALRQQARPRVVMGMDTRESGPWLAEYIMGGLGSVGVAADFAGLITTPGIAYLTKSLPYLAGVMISASHNTYEDNGIKVIGHSGYKLPDDQEALLEHEILHDLERDLEPARLTGTADEGLWRRYVDYLISTLPVPLDGLRVVIDCAHGAGCHLVLPLFSRLGADVEIIGCAPNGRNINLHCGALHVETLRETVLLRKAHLGVALDGDADRAIFVSGSGNIVNGDGVLLLAARFLLDQGRLTALGNGPAVIATVMSNLGLEKALAEHGVHLVRTPVGDKYVLEEMLRRGATLGGEQSGHLIFREYATTGDGLLTALRVMEIMRATGQDLDELTKELKVYPQRLVNVRVRERKALESLPLVVGEIRAAEESLGDTGRILVRFSGTEPLARVMVEGPDEEHVEHYAGRIAAAIQSELGGTIC